jgi:carboxylesterase
MNEGRLDPRLQPSARPNTVPLASVQPVPRAAHPVMLGAEPFLYKAGNIGCLLIHGFTSTPYEMRELGRFLAERGVTASAPLLPGHGTAPEDLAFTTWRDWHAQVNAALDELLAHCKRVYLAGLSLGGALTLYTASQRGKDLAGIIAMSSPIYVPHSLTFVMRGLRYNVPYLYKPYKDIEDPDARARHISYDRSPMEATASLVEFLSHVRYALPHVKVPSLVIYARHDHVVPCVSSHYIYSRLGTARKQMLALHRGFHIVTADTDREKVQSSIYDFVANNENHN